jgi:hypothetical protein
MSLESAIILIRTDTTLDLSQKAEKGMLALSPAKVLFLAVYVSKQVDDGGRIHTIRQGLWAAISKDGRALNTTVSAEDGEHSKQTSGWSHRPIKVDVRRLKPPSKSLTGIRWRPIFRRKEQLLQAPQGSSYIV